MYGTDDTDTADDDIMGGERERDRENKEIIRCGNINCFKWREIKMKRKRKKVQKWKCSDDDNDVDVDDGQTYRCTSSCRLLVVALRVLWSFFYVFSVLFLNVVRCKKKVNCVSYEMKLGYDYDSIQKSYIHISRRRRRRWRQSRRWVTGKSYVKTFASWYWNTFFTWCAFVWPCHMPVSLNLSHTHSHRHTPCC